MTAKTEGLYLQALVAAGLSKEQARIYESLLQKGGMPAGRVARLVGYTRPYVYKLLDELVDLGVITKEDVVGKPTQYVPLHPFAIQELFRNRQKEVAVADKTIRGVMSSLISEYTASLHLPGIRILPGLEGVAELYEDILQESKNICLIRSTLDDDRPERMDLVLGQIKKQVAKKINTRLIGPVPLVDAPSSTAELLERDRSRLTTRRILPRDQFSLPAQIIIYGNKVALTSYHEPLVTTIIENEAIRTTVTTLFELIWAMAREPETLSR